MVIIDLINGIFLVGYRYRSIIGRLRQQYHLIDIVAWLSSIITQLLSRNCSLQSHSYCRLVIVNLHIEIVYRRIDTVYRHVEKICVSIIAQRDLQGHRNNSINITGSAKRIDHLSEKIVDFQRVSYIITYLFILATAKKLNHDH